MDKELVYNLLEIKYLKTFGKNVTLNMEDDHDLYPNGWFLNSDYTVKSKILAEAINKKIKIIDTEAYQEIIEGVKKSNK